MNRYRMTLSLAPIVATLLSALVLYSQQAGTGPGSGNRPTPPRAAKTITEADCTAAKLGSEIPVNAIGEPVSAVTLGAPQWHAQTSGAPAYCSIEGIMAPVDKSPTAQPIRFGVALPASWELRAAQLGGGGMNGTIPRLTGGVSRGDPTPLEQGFATYGSDSGHQSGGFGMPRGGMRQPAGAGPGGPSPARGMPAGFGAPNPAADRWALNDEAVANLGYMQLKKTHDAAMVLMQRIYGDRPRFSYFIGGSQGGREALTVAQRYPADYDGIAAEVPIVNFSSLMLAPELIRIQEKPLANWVTPAKVNAIRGEFMRQCDKLDGLVDGVINNYMACRAIFDVRQGAPNRNPWAAKRCPEQCRSESAGHQRGGLPHRRPDRNSEADVLALRVCHAARKWRKELRHVGPEYRPVGERADRDRRYRGQEGAAEDAPTHSHLGVLGVTGFLMRDLSANPLDYVEGGPLNKRRVELSAILDSTNPDLSAFQKRGSKLIVVIGTNDTLASPGAQLDYYQSVLDKMGRTAVDSFARFWVLPQTGHGLSGSTYNVDGDGKEIAVQAIPNTYDRLGLIVDWVENGKAPGKQVKVTADERSLPMCSYPAYPKYTGGEAGDASSYACSLN